MSQFLYVLIIIGYSFLCVLIYQIFIKKNKVIKFILQFMFLMGLVYICYNYNYFIFNYYVVLSIIAGVLLSIIVKNYVNKRFKDKYFNSKHK